LRAVVQCCTGRRLSSDKHSSARNSVPGRTGTTLGCVSSARTQRAVSDNIIRPRLVPRNVVDPIGQDATKGTMYYKPNRRSSQYHERIHSLIAAIGTVFRRTAKYAAHSDVLVRSVGEDVQD
jgi:hypothetical protein